MGFLINEIGSAYLLTLILLGLSCCIGYILLMFQKEKKIRAERKRQQENELKKELGLETEDKLADLEKTYDKKG